MFTVIVPTKRLITISTYQSYPTISRYGATKNVLLISNIPFAKHTSKMYLKIKINLNKYE